ncbi:MAG: hypothetical protein NVSMB16_09750 [Acidimicrobiales bacterium]
MPSVGTLPEEITSSASVGPLPEDPPPVGVFVPLSAIGGTGGWVDPSDAATS